MVNASNNILYMDAVGFSEKSRFGWSSKFNEAHFKERNSDFSWIPSRLLLGGAFIFFEMFTPIWQKIPTLTYIFQMVWKPALYQVFSSNKTRDSNF